VLVVGHHLEVVEGVVRLVFVLVVDDLVATEATAELALDEEAVAELAAFVLAAVAITDHPTIRLGILEDVEEVAAIPDYPGRTISNSSEAT
jgi:hypothetical protein